MNCNSVKYGAGDDAVRSSGNTGTAAEAEYASWLGSEGGEAFVRSFPFAFCSPDRDWKRRWNMIIGTAFVPWAWYLFLAWACVFGVIAVLAVLEAAFACWGAFFFGNGSFLSTVHIFRGWRFIIQAAVYLLLGFRVLQHWIRT